MNIVALIKRALGPTRSKLPPPDPSFAPGLYIIGSAAVIRQHAEIRADRGEANFADALLCQVAEALELRLDGARRDDGEVELRAALLEVAHVVKAWVEAIDQREREAGR